MKLSIGWDNSDNNVLQTFKELCNDQNFADVTMVSLDDQQIRAHKIVLSASSMFFKNMFARNSHRNILVYLKDVQYKHLKLIIQFIYTGQCDIDEKELPQFLSVGKELGVIGLLKTNQNESNNTLKDNVSMVEREENIEIGYENRNKLIGEVINDRMKVYTSSDQIEKGEIIDNIQLVNEVMEYACKQCEYRAKQKGNLKNHIQSVHERVRYECNHCEYKATRKAHLTTHKQSLHEGVRFKCDECYLTFKWERHLRHHIHVVHEEMRYVCNQCEFKARQLCHLKIHIKSVHEGVWIYCNQCEYKTAEKRHLRRHRIFIHKEVQ